MKLFLKGPNTEEEKKVAIVVWVFCMFMPWIVKPSVDDVRAWRRRHKEEMEGWRLEYRVMPPKYHDRLTRWDITDGDDFTSKYYLTMKG